jgi:hypothetical protein
MAATRNLFEKDLAEGFFNYQRDNPDWQAWSAISRQMESIC